MRLFALTALLALSIAASTVASAKEINWTWSDMEQDEFVALLDLAAKQGGVNASLKIAYFVQKLQAARVQSNAGPQPKAEEKKADEPKKPEAPKAK